MINTQIFSPGFIKVYGDIKSQIQADLDSINEKIQRAEKMFTKFVKENPDLITLIEIIKTRRETKVELYSTYDGDHMKVAGNDRDIVEISEGTRILKTFSVYCDYTLNAFYKPGSCIDVLKRSDFEKLFKEL